MKSLPNHPTTDDQRVAAFIKRMSTGNPLQHMQSIQITTQVGDFTRITVSFIADADFDAPPPAPPTDLERLERLETRLDALYDHLNEHTTHGAP